MIATQLQNLLNRNIAQSSAAKVLCVRLNGKRLRLQLTGLPFALTLLADTEGVRLSTDTDSPVDARISGTLLGLFNLANSQTPAASGGSVQIEGDAEVAQKFSELLKAARPDLEEELARIVGDVTAHHIGNTTRHILDFMRRGRDTFLQNAGEYLSEESRDVPSRTEAEEFLRDVDRLRDDVERLDARLAALEARRAPRA